MEWYETTQKTTMEWYESKGKIIGGSDNCC